MEFGLVWFGFGLNHGSSTTTPGAPDAPPFAPPPPSALAADALQARPGRRRIFIYTLPPVEVASIFCQVAVDMGYEDQFEVEYGGTSTKHERRALVAGRR
ncbi:hypothetical protein B0H14DRAFT_3520023 [Mycena olivaceomarginata]|nr:hypothetical protein B0H14DRAFT_3520023 [Mycena olivaceomarginata]